MLYTEFENLDSKAAFRRNKTLVSCSYGSQGISLYNEVRVQLGKSRKMVISVMGIKVLISSKLAEIEIHLSVESWVFQPARDTQQP